MLRFQRDFPDGGTTETSPGGGQVLQSHMRQIECVGNRRKLFLGKRERHGIRWNWNSPANRSDRARID